MYYGVSSKGSNIFKPVISGGGDDYLFLGKTVFVHDPDIEVQIMGKHKGLDILTTRSADKMKSAISDSEWVAQGQPDKIRYIDKDSNQMFLRVDDDSYRQINKKALEDLYLYDAVIVSDYNKGYVTYEFVESLRKKFDGPIFIDTKKPDLERFKGCIVKINRDEWDRRTSEGMDTYIITGGGDDVTIRFAGSQHEEYIMPPRVEAHDPCGCGDSFLASLVYDYLKNQDMMKAVEFAVQAAAITVTRTGVYAPTLEEITGEDYTYH